MYLSLVETNCQIAFTYFEIKISENSGVNSTLQKIIYFPLKGVNNLRSKHKSESGSFFFENFVLETSNTGK